MPYKTKSVGRSKISNLIVGEITGVEVDVTKKQETEEEINTNIDNQTGGEQDALLAKGAEFANKVMSSVNATSDMVSTLNNMPSSISLGTGTDSSPGSGSGSGSKHSDCCPLLDDNLLGMLKGIFTVDLLKGFYKEGAQLTVDKINEQLSDVTKEPAVVKQEIYDKILEVFRAHLTSEEGREMIFKYINKIMEANIKQLTEETEIAKQGFISILKHGSPEIRDIFESALDRVLFEKDLNDLKAVNKYNIGAITESMRTEIKEFIIDKYKKNTGKDISVEASAPVMVQADAIPVTDATLDAKQHATPVAQADATEVVTRADATLVTQADATLVEKTDAIPVAIPVATAEVVKQYKISGGAKKQKRFTKKQKRFTKKQKRSRQTKRRQTKRRVNKSGRVRIRK